MTMHLPDNQEDREVYLREHRAANYVEMVNDARDQSTEVIMTVGAFAGEPETLYVALEYACLNGVSVTMAGTSPKPTP